MRIWIIRRASQARIRRILATLGIERIDWTWQALHFASPKIPSLAKAIATCVQHGAGSTRIWITFHNYAPTVESCLEADVARAIGSMVGTNGRCVSISRTPGTLGRGGARLECSLKTVAAMVPNAAFRPAIALSAAVVNLFVPLLTLTIGLNGRTAGRHHVDCMNDTGALTGASSGRAIQLGARRTS